MANKNFKNYAIPGNNVTLTYDDINDNVTIDVNVDKNDVGLGNVDNTSDIDKPISTLVQNALNLKEGVITLGTTAQYWRGDKTFQTLDKNAVGLSNVDNTSDANKPISNATQTALNGKQNTITLTTSGNSGASTFAANVLNIPNYTLAGLGGISLTSLSSTATGLTYNNTNGVFSLTTGYSIPTTANQSNWDNAYTNRITSLTTTGSSGAATLASNVLNIPNYTLAGLNGQPLNANLTSISALTYSALGFVKMTAAGTFALDTNTYLTAESDTLNSVTGRGNSTTNFITVGGITANQSVTASAGVGRGSYFNQTLVASANNDVLVGLDINPTFTNGAFTGVTNYGLRVQKTSLFNDTWANGQAIFGQVGQAGLIKIARGDAASFATLGFNSAGGPVFIINSTFNTIIQNNGTDSITIGANSLTLNAPLSASNLIFSIGATKYAQFFNTTGNLVIQSGGTFTDAGYRLDVNGTVRIQNQLTTTGSITAASAIARGVYMNNTLVAAANNDVLVGLDIQPTFTTGAFTGLTQLAVRVKGQIVINNSSGSISAFYFPDYTDVYGSSYSFNTHGAYNISFIAQDTGNIIFRTGATNKIQLFNTGNLVIQNGGTFTDAGYRFDVNGSTRLNGALTLGMTPIVAASVVSTHKLQITIAGTTYYLLASNV